MVGFACGVGEGVVLGRGEIYSIHTYLNRKYIKQVISHPGRFVNRLLVKWFSVGGLVDEGRPVKRGEEVSWRLEV